jgi:hypothetical protein
MKGFGLDVRHAIRATVLAIASTASVGSAAAGERCIVGQVLDTYFAVRHQAWTECDCEHATKERTFRRCYVRAVRRLAAEQGLPQACIRELTTGEAVRSTCGRPNAVACCTQRPVAGGLGYYCAIKRSAKRCVPPAGGGACIVVGQQDCFTGEGADSNCGCSER